MSGKSFFLEFKLIGNFLPQLQKLYAVVGTDAGAAVPLWQWRAGGELYNKLAGFDCILNEHCSALGDKGDIFLADFSKYALIEKQVKQSISAHLYFLTDESAFRLVYRFDGQPMVNAPITPKHAAAGAEQSPFVVLANRA